MIFTGRISRIAVTTACVSGSLPAMLDPFLYDVTVTARTGRTIGEVETALDAEIDRIAREPISGQELRAAVKQAQAQFAYSSESVTNQGFWLGYSSVVADTGWFESFLDRLSAVTVDDVARVAKAYLARRNRIVGHYIPQGV